MAIAFVVEQLLFLVQWKRVVRVYQRIDGVYGAIGYDDIEPAIIVIIEKRGA